MVESSSDDILADAEKVDVAFLVVGDPFGYVYPSPFPRPRYLARDVQLRD